MHFILIIYPIPQPLICVASLEGELAHRMVKRLYGLTNKKDAIKQIAKKYSRHDSFRQHEDECREEVDAAKNGNLEAHHVITRSRNNPIALFPFLRVNPQDPAKKVHTSH